MEGDEAFYYQHEDGELKGVDITYVDDFALVGTEEFVDKVLEIVSKELTVSKIEQDSFRYTGIDVSVNNDVIEIQIGYSDAHHIQRVDYPATYPIVSAVGH